MKILPNKVAGLKWITLVLILGAFFRFWGTFQTPTYIEDEAIHVTSAISLAPIYGSLGREFAPTNMVVPVASAEDMSRISGFIRSGNIYSDIPRLSHS